MEPAQEESAAIRSGGGKKTHTVFVYGTLKRGFGNHWLTEEMIAGGHAEFLGFGRSKEKYPLVCGPYQVPFLLPMEGSGQHVWGELYAVDPHALARFDELEGTAKGHYVRRSIRVVDGGNNKEIQGQAYFAGNSYAGRLWMKTGNNKCLSCYSEEESKNYVKRKDRPSHLTFLQHINIFVSAPHHEKTSSPVNPAFTTTVAAAMADC